MSSTHTENVHPEFDPRTETYQVYHDSDSSWEASTTLVLSLSSLTDDAPQQMHPLSSVVDPDVLNGHVRSQNQDATLSFEFHDHRVTVRQDGRIQFDPLQDGEHYSSTTGS